MSAQQSFRVGLVQMSMSATPEANTEKAVAKVREAASLGADVVCLPELYRSPYFCQKEDHAAFALAEPVPGPSTQALGRVAKEAGVAVVVPIFERRAPGVYHNSAVVLDAQGAVVGLYRKMHIPDDPLFYEKFYFAPGDLGFLAFDVGKARIGTLICWDQWYPEAARLTALRGASVLFYPTAIGWHPSEKAEHGDAAARRLADDPARARDRQRRLRGGREPRRTRGAARAAATGSSSGAAPSWSIPSASCVAEASVEREEILVGEVRLPRIEEVRLQLALPARPPDRRLLRNRPALPGREVEHARAPASGVGPACRPAASRRREA